MLTVKINEIKMKNEALKKNILFDSYNENVVKCVTIIIGTEYIFFVNELF